jgi:hypothetical protein
LSQDLNPEYGLKFGLSSANDSVSMYVKTGVRGKERKSFTMKFEYQSNICSDRNSCERRASPLGINVDGMVRRNKVRNSAGK